MVTNKNETSVQVDKVNDFKTTEFDIKMNKNDEYAKDNHIKDTVPQTLITCLDELQQNGKLISWNIRGHGENLTVKVTWNCNKSNKASSLSSSPLSSSVNTSASTITSASNRNIPTSASLKKSLTFSEKIENNQKFKKELTSFCVGLTSSLHAMKLRLFTKRSQEEYYKIISSCKIELTSLIKNLIQMLSINASILNDKDDVKLLIIDEIEKCLKYQSGTLKQELSKNNLTNTNTSTTYPKVYEDLIARAIIKKTEIDNLEKAIDSHDSFINDFLNDLDDDSFYMYNTVKQRLNTQDNLITTLNSIIKTPKQNDKNGENGTLNNTFERTLVHHNDSRNSVDAEIICPKEKINDWQENWSFVEKKTEELQDAVLQSQIAFENEDDSSDIVLVDDDDSDKEGSYELNKSKINAKEKFPIPKNILLNKQQTSSSYYRPIDDRLESDTDSDFGSTYKIINQAKTTATNSLDRIKPNANIRDPAFVKRPDDKLIRYGETAKFICKVEGTSPFNVNWYRINGEELTNNDKYELYHDDQYYYLKIYYTNRDDCGDYLCVIANKLNQNNDSFNLKLRDYCGDGVYHLHIPFVSDEDNAEYKCVAINNAAKIETKAELYVIEKENVKRPDTTQLRHSQDDENLSFKNLESINFIQNNAKSSYTSLSKSILDDTKMMNQTETPTSTLSYELLNDYELDLNNDDNTEGVILKSISTLEVPREQLKKIENDKPASISSQFSKTLTSKQHRAMPNDHSLTFITSHSSLKKSDNENNLLSSSSYGSSINEQNQLKTKNQIIKDDNDCKKALKSSSFVSILDKTRDQCDPQLLAKSKINKLVIMPETQLNDDLRKLSNKSIELKNEYTQLKIESVKELKKLWEQVESSNVSRLLANKKENISHNSHNSHNSRTLLKMNKSNLKRKWSSLTNVGEYNSNIRKTNSDTNVTIKVKSILKSNDGNCFCEKINDQNDENYDKINPQLNSDSNIVKRLKLKFDNKDQSFIKVASLTCRNVTKDISTSNCNRNNNRPMLSLYEPIQDDIEATNFELNNNSNFKSDVKHVDKLIEYNNLLDACSNDDNFHSSSKNTSKNNLNCSTSTTLNASITSKYNINLSQSSFRQSRLSVESCNQLATHSSNTSICKSNINKNNSCELMNSKATTYNKVYDSNFTNSINSEQTNDDYDRQARNIVKDYKKLMNKNFRSKESSVLAKVKLWDNHVKWGETE